MGMQNRKLVLGAVIIGSGLLSSAAGYASINELMVSDFHKNNSGYKCPNHRRPEKKLRRAKR